ncbi:ABC transporter ATP-binding protein [Nocardioides marmoriginsengisoli]|uniref:ABC transporter ATP-binding protein n=1 Tax=Nocardioides marmoriginsengisoli TaxID=661483 RepID=A0A3N0CH56_9ACTN|nr:ABC transporter ATP-binding protein [Nocardioides marmoriginsengisoli]RNL62619.1 ABC transporter ATP-binding protein [Nocardioides marmoriginsengisoli]
MSLEFTATVADRGLEVAFEVATGETLALLGPNGAGKSTVLSVIAGLLRPDTGRVVLDDRTLVATDERVDLAPHLREVALLAQEPLLFPHLSVRENVAFGPRSRGRSRTEARAAADAWLDRVGAAELGDRKPGEVSGGQAQRIAVARALAAEPHLLLLDEPMAALDVAVTPALRQTLRQVLADRTTVLVTHDVLDALLLADRVLVIDEGRVVEEGRSGEVLAQPRSAFAARLAGLNLLHGTWRGDHAVLPDGSQVHGIVAGPEPAVGDLVVATFRPHAVAVYLERPVGSPRNVFATTIDDLEPLGDLIRVRAGQLSADVTAHSVAALDLVLGTAAQLTVKATEVAIYRL